MSLKKQMFYLTLVLAWLLLLSPTASAATKQWHALVTGILGEAETTTQIYGYTKNTQFGEIVIECDDTTGEETGFAFLNSRIGEKDLIIEDGEETVIKWENPRTLNFLECQFLAPNIPTRVDIDWQHHWDHPDDPLRYKTGPPIWPGDPSWALLAPSVPNNKLVVVKATNPNPYPVRAKIAGVFPTKQPPYWNDITYEAEATVEFAPGETKYLKLPEITNLVTHAETTVSAGGSRSYSTLTWNTGQYQILAEDYPPELMVDGSTTIDVPPYTPVNGFNYEHMIYHPSQNQPEEIPTPFNLQTKRVEPNWTRSFQTSNMSQLSGSFYGWEFIVNPITGPSVIANADAELNTIMFYRGDVQMWAPKGSFVDTRIQKDYWWPYNDGWNSLMPILITDETLVWTESYSFVSEGNNYGNLTSTPQICRIIRRKLDGRPEVKNQINVNACEVEVVERINYENSGGCESVPISTTKTYYTWNGSGFTSTQTTTPYADEIVGVGKATMVFTNIVQTQNPSPLTVSFGTGGGYGCDGSYNFEITPQVVHLPQTAQFDTLLTEEVGVSLPNPLDGDISINIVIPANQVTTLVADQYTVEMPFESGINITNLTSVLNRVSIPDEVIFPNGINAEFAGADPAQIWGIWRNWLGGTTWSNYEFKRIGFVAGGEGSASSYYSAANPYGGHLSATPGLGKWVTSFPKQIDRNSVQAYYFRVLDNNGNVYPQPYNP